MKQQKILFLTLYTFSLTGGIEKVCINLMNVFKKLKQQNVIQNAFTLSMYDDASEMDNFKAFKGNQIPFAINAIKKGLEADIVILSHINLLIFAKLINLLYPAKRIILLAHGIEIWKPLASWKKKLLGKIDIWAVSNFTANQIQHIQQIDATNIKVLNNSLSEGFKFQKKIRPSELVKQYELQENQQIILTICRIAATEQYKGYDMVLMALKEIIKQRPNVKYFIVGKADFLEQKRIDQLIENYQLENHVICTGYVSDEEVNMFYKLADIFAMPSKGEGFGLVFIEAAANGCQVLAGNIDGSVDALLNGELGILVDPLEPAAITEALITLLNQPFTELQIAEQQEKAKTHFKFENHCNNVKQLLTAKNLPMASKPTLISTS